MLRKLAHTGTSFSKLLRYERMQLVRLLVGPSVRAVEMETGALRRAVVAHFLAAQFDPVKVSVRAPRRSTVIPRQQERQSPCVYRPYGPGQSKNSPGKHLNDAPGLPRHCGMCAF